MTDMKDDLMNKKLLIIGNGFDRAHFLPTSYEDFKKYMSDLIREYSGLDKNGKCITLNEIPESTIPNIHTADGIIADYDGERKIVYWLIDDVARKRHDVKWGEFENYLGQLRVKKLLKKWGTDDLDVQCLRDSISDISGFFFEWINTIDVSIVKKREPYMSIIEKNDIAICFNYTETLENVYGMKPTNICYIHGQRETDATLQQEKSMMPIGKDTSNLVVGFGLKYVRNRREIVEKNLLMPLYKDTESIIYSHRNFFNTMINSQIKEVYSFGFSFSDSDRPYIKRICEQLKSIANDSEMTWFISPYGNTLRRSREEIYFRKCIRQAGFRGKICRLKLNT